MVVRLNLATQCCTPKRQGEGAELNTLTETYNLDKHSIIILISLHCASSDKSNAQDFATSALLPQEQTPSSWRSDLNRTDRLGRCTSMYQ